MKKAVKKVSAILLAGAMLVSAVPVSAGSVTKYGHTMNYSKARVSNIQGRAVTTCTGANSVYAKVNVTFNSGGIAGKKDSASNSSREATTATINLSADSYITGITGNHKADVTYQGLYKTIVASS